MTVEEGFGVAGAAAETWLHVTTSARANAYDLLIIVIFGRHSRFGAQKTRGGIAADHIFSLPKRDTNPYAAQPMAGH
jgi:hypothetical protein